MIDTSRTEPYPNRGSRQVVGPRTGFRVVFLVIVVLRGLFRRFRYLVVLGRAFHWLARLLVILSVLVVPYGGLRLCIVVGNVLLRCWTVRCRRVIAACVTGEVFSG